ncbi:ATP-binding protein [Streptomyces aidingensis]|uniref:Histidine kinase-like ATPase domain-containing protein n=1 Tax=Streptomyces aidingensis TaxID=910347 RepID=A0A1I1E059_9ACTN|nr:ATP-binding protein [Streptomyces aidingensis]SFB80056.1 Histidine kinase-like ATPase domain-containing protein [Streptomyces aidingensis]
MCPLPTALCHPPSPPDGFTLSFPPQPEWVRTARHAVRTALLGSAACKPELTETATLLTSEAVSNAVTASLNSRCPDPVLVQALWARDGGIQILVRDGARGLPVPPAGFPSPDAEHGRDLLMIDLFATAWGICTHTLGHGKAVWFCL